MKKQLVIMGATGNLARLYLIPCLYHLWLQGEEVKIIAVGLEQWSKEEFCARTLAAMKDKGSAPEGIEQNWLSFSQTIVYIPLDLETATYELPKVA